ncbi:T9SS type B sorting domain-containing protein [Bizionia sp.]|uniref:T9SS type B sorting domain-containing protein n=2 Tax=unclassified Bizionia TaxID=2626393 RepID=UPI003A91FFF5
MRLLYLFLLFGIFCTTIFSQTTAIPDPNFEQVLIDQGIDTNGLNGNILDSDAQVVTILDLGINGIVDITGINAFINITDLDLGTNQIADINLSTLTQLITLRSEDNDALTTLNVTQNTLLEYVFLASRPSLPGIPPITVMDFSQNSNIISIEIRWFNNVSDFITPVTNTLTHVNIRALGDATLDFSLLDNLEDLQIRGSSIATNITLPNVFTNLTYLNITSINIPTIDISDYINLEAIYFWGTYVENLILPNSTTLTDIFIILHNIQIPMDFSIMPNLTDIDITLNQTTPLVVDVTQNYLLEDLDLANNDMTSLDVTQNAVLRNLDISRNNLTSLDLTQNLELYRLDAYENQLPSIDLTQNIILEYLNLRQNLIPILDVTQNIIIRSINIANNLFTGTGLDLTQNPTLASFVASFNQIESLDISQNANLSYLVLDNNLFSGTEIMDQFYTIRLNAGGIYGGSLILSHNLLSGQIPDFASLIAMRLGQPIGFNLAFDNNYFEFGHFENQHADLVLYDNTFGPPPHWNTIPNIRDYFYAPQAKVDVTETINANAGDAVTLTTACAGTQNHYTWFKNGVAIPDAPDSPTYTIPAVTSCDEAVYHSEILSDLVPFENASPAGTGGKNLLLIRNDITLNITSPTEDCVNLISPAPGSTAIPINETLTWSDNLGACGYFISIGTTSGGTDILDNEDVGDVNSFNLGTDFPLNTVIYVTITPYFYSGTTLTCTQVSFTTAATASPTVCTLLNAPTAGELHVPLIANVSWDSSPYATGYIISMGTTPGGIDIADTIDVGNVTSYNPPMNLPESTIIYVTISPYNSLGIISGCTEESFTTEGFYPPCTNLIAPLNADTNVAISSDISWNPISEATGYILTVGTTSGGIDIVDNLDVNNMTTYNFPADLPYGTQIFVSVTPYNSAGNALGCTEETFTTEIIPPLCTALTMPLNGETNVLLSSNISWNAIPTATGYILTVGTTSGGIDIADNLDVSNVTSYNFPTDLPENSQIFVTITPYNSVGNATGCVEESFTTELLPPICTQLTTPVNGSTVVPVATDLFWNASPTATGYILSVGTASGGTDIVDNLDVNNVTTYNLPTDLPAETTIFVTVSPYNSSGTNSTCFEVSFITELPLPTCINVVFPLYQATNVPVNTNISWAASDFATGYTISLGTTTGATDILNITDVGNVTTYSPLVDLPSNTTIFVTIGAYNGTGSTVCGDDQFTTEDLNVNCVSLTTPLNNATNVSLLTNLTWNPDVHAEGYMLTVGSSPGGTDIANNLDVGNVTTYTFPAELPQNQQIFVTIQPYNFIGIATGCAEERFLTELLIPDCTSLNSPQNNETQVPINTTLSWLPTDNTTGYIISAGTSPFGAELLNNVDVGNSTSYNFNSDLPSNTIIYVVITPYNEAGPATSCNEVSFTTEEVIPLCTELIMPYSGEIDVLENSSISWIAVNNATGYVLNIGKVSGVANLVSNEDVGNTTTYNPTTNWPEGETIYISITPYNNVGVGVACNEQSFTIINRDINTPAFFTPNGDGQNDVWRVADLQNEIKQITIFDRYGKLIKQLHNRSAGWDGTFRGIEQPTSDYWFLMELHSGEQRRGHFTLKR